MKIYLKSGAVVETDDELRSVERDRISGRITALNWTRKPESVSVYYVSMDDIVAIVDTSPKDLKDKKGDFQKLTKS